MDSVIEGKVYVLGDDVDTDQIIPAKFLMYDPSVPEERKLFGRHALSGRNQPPSDGRGGHINGRDARLDEGKLAVWMRETSPAH